MNSGTKILKVSKACEECRARKVRCDGSEPCRHCTQRSTQCVYRAKPRNRKRKTQPQQQQQPQSRQQQNQQKHDEESVAAASIISGNTPATQALTPPPHGDHDSGIPMHHSVAATHRSSPSCPLQQLYYGPTSNFSLLHSIYHQVTNNRPGWDDPGAHEVEEVGPGLDHFSHRRLFFGDLADGDGEGTDCSAMFLDPTLATECLERYLATYYQLMPVLSRQEYRRRIDQLYASPAVFSTDSPNTILVLLAMALGASMLNHEKVAQFLFLKAKKGACKLDEVVNIQYAHFQSERAKPNSCFLYVGTAMRKAVAAGLHKDANTQGGLSKEDIAQRRLTFWSVYFWETWICFSLGRPTSAPDPGTSVPAPVDHPHMLALIQLSRIMSACASRIYNTKHQSLLTVWNAADDVRRQLHEFAQKPGHAMDIGLNGETAHGHLGVFQAMVSTMYNHTLLLAFRPFLVLRAKLRRHSSASGEQVYPSPAGLDSTCDRCLEAARHSIAFLTTSCRHNIMCREIKYHAFFLEGACYTLALDMLSQEHFKEAGSPNHLPWIRTGLDCLRSMMPPGHHPDSQAANPVPATISSLERMVRAAFPDLADSAFSRYTSSQHAHTNGATLGGRSNERDVESSSGAENSVSASARVNPPSTPGRFPTGVDILVPPLSSASSGLLNNIAAGDDLLFPPLPALSTSLGIDLSGNFAQAGGLQPGGEPHGNPLNLDLTAADIGWDIDFATMDMEAFLSIDPNQPEAYQLDSGAYYLLASFHAFPACWCQLLPDAANNSLPTRKRENLALSRPFGRHQDGITSARQLSTTMTTAGQNFIHLRDQPARGLDSKTALEFAETPRRHVDEEGETIIAIVYQAGNGTYDTFGKVLVLV
ncbi:hypothetical protein MKZ38_003984 [Zalerion maritima]|uniref:Zn(2)-C6 fungal-type domain-containing protein n=1 Tax=Zalerion maritima TaxID=339359 RepID=A0AAD5RMQ4_9PEZI|nr:hypothetical protein MKZ38_003984 [Zalerion maritima]